MGLLLLVLGIILWLTVSSTLGLILVVVGLILMFVPNTYGPRDWRRGV